MGFGCFGGVPTRPKAPRRLTAAGHQKTFGGVQEARTNSFVTTFCPRSVWAAISLPHFTNSLCLLDQENTNCAQYFTSWTGWVPCHLHIDRDYFCIVTQTLQLGHPGHRFCLWDASTLLTGSLRKPLVTGPRTMSLEMVVLDAYTRGSCGTACS